MANKKINQLVAKTTILSTDLFPLGDGTTGQLFKKTIAELQAAIGGAVISVNGLVGTVVLDTDDIQELASPTNRYFTEARARAAISLTTTGSSGASTYSSSTGVLNVPTYTLAGLGGITASFLSGGTGITYNSGTGVISYSGTVYTDASVRALVSAGAGLSYNSSTGVFSYSGTVYTDSSIRALISLTTSGSSGASTYNNTTGVLNVPTYTLAGLGGISLASLSGSAPITYNSSTGAIGITQASGSTNGFLSSTDWTTFNGKQNALTLGNVTEAVSNVLMFPDGQNGKTIGNLSIQVVQAGSTTNGFLSTTDWNTFNNKQNAITLTTTGTSGAATFSGGTLNIPQYQGVLTNPVTGTGTSGHVAFFNGSGSIAGDAGHFWDNTNKRLGIGTATPSYALEVKQTGVNSTIWGYNIAQFADAQTNNNGLRIGTSVGTSGLTNLIAATANDASQFGFWTFSGSAWGERLRITSAGNVGINTTSFTPFGSRLQMIMKGDATSGVSVMQVTSNDSASSVALFSGSGTSDAPAIIYQKDLRFGSVTDSGIGGYTDRMRITSTGNVGIGIVPSAWGGTVVRGFQVGFGASFSGNSSAPDAYMTANCYFDGSNWRYINTNTALSYDARGDGGDYVWQNAGSGTAGNVVSFTERMRLKNNGNLLLGTSTDNGERLYVSGSIRATGSITANSDVRLKKNIERIENALQKVSEISGYTYNTIYDEDRHAGVIAQEIDKVLPEIVNKGNDGLMGVEYGNISALLIEAIKDLKKDNESLRAIVEGLSK